MFPDIDKYIVFLLDLSVWLYTQFNVFFSPCQDMHRQCSPTQKSKKQKVQQKKSRNNLLRLLNAEQKQKKRRENQLLEFIVTHCKAVCMFKKHKNSSITINTHNAVCMAVANHWIEAVLKKKGGVLIGRFMKAINLSRDARHKKRQTKDFRR